MKKTVFKNIYIVIIIAIAIAVIILLSYILIIVTNNRYAENIGRDNINLNDNNNKKSKDESISESIGESINETKNNKDINFNINFFKEYISNKKSEIELIFSDRKIMCDNDKLLIGNNKKQLENGYYDVKFYITNTKDNGNVASISININKLYITDSNLVIEKGYLTRIINLINDTLSLDLCQNELEEIYMKVSKEYTYMRTSYVENVDKLDEFSLNGYNFVISINKSNLILNIQDKR